MTNEAHQLINDFSSAPEHERPQRLLKFPPNKLDVIVQALQEKQVDFSQVLTWVSQEIEHFTTSLATNLVEDVSSQSWQERLLLQSDAIVSFANFTDAINQYFSVVQSFEFQADQYETIKNLKESDLREDDSLVEAYLPILGTVERYFDLVISALQRYLATQSGKTIPFELTQFPLKINHADVQTVINLKTFFHDLNNIFAVMKTVAQPIASYRDDYFSILDEPELKSKEKCKSLHSTLVKIIELRKSFNFEKGRFACTETPVILVIDQINDFYLQSKKTDRYSIEVTDNSEISLPLESGVATSFLDLVLLKRVISNIEQNAARLLQDNPAHFTEKPLVITIYYHFTSGEKVKNNQVEKEGNAQWLEIVFSDNGPGFPIKATDHKGTEDTSDVVYFKPEVGKSERRNVRGSGLGLAGLEDTFAEYQGAFLTYTLLEKENEKKPLGAVIKLRVPLLKAE